MYGCCSSRPAAPSSRATLAAQFLSTESSFNVETVRHFFKTAILAFLGAGTILEGRSAAADVTIPRLNFGLRLASSSSRFWARKCAACGWSVQLQRATVGEEEAAAAPRAEKPKPKWRSPQLRWQPACQTVMGPGAFRGRASPPENHPCSFSDRDAAAWWKGCGGCSLVMKTTGRGELLPPPSSRGSRSPLWRDLCEPWRVRGKTPGCAVWCQRVVCAWAGLALWVPRCSPRSFSAGRTCRRSASWSKWRLFAKTKTKIFSSAATPGTGRELSHQVLFCHPNTFWWSTQRKTDSSG